MRRCLPGWRLYLAAWLLSSGCRSPIARGLPEDVECDAELEFSGNETLSSKDLEETLVPLMVDLCRLGIDQTGIDDAIYELERYYTNQGFPAPVITARWEGAASVFSIRFLIVEGPREYVDDLEFRGNQVLDLDALAECFQWIQEGKLGGLTQYVLGPGSEVLGLQRPVFTERELAAGLECVKSVYQLEGYYFVETHHELREDAPGQVTVRVQIEEGPRVRLVRPVLFDGVRSFPEAEIRAVLGLEEEGGIFVPRLPLVLKGRVLDYYRTRGYPFAEVDAIEQFDRERAEARVRLRVKEGPKAAVRDIRIQGLEHTWESVVDRYIKLRPGETYDAEKVRASSRSLLRTGLFDAVHIDVVRLEDTDEEVDLLVNVSEKARYRISALAGYGSWEQLRGSIAVENANVLGSGHRLGAQGAASFRHHRFSVSYVNPYFFHEDISQDVDGFYEQREHPSFSVEEFGTEAGFGFRWTRELRSRVFHSFRESHVFEATGLLPPELEEDVLVSSINLSVLHDNRASFVDPRSGGVQRARLEYAGSEIGSELDFLRPTVALSWIFPLTEGQGLRLATAASTGAIFKFRDTQVIPIQERFFAGGETSIRSFEQDEAGPRIGDEPIGGEAFLVFNLELRYRLGFVPLLEDLDGAVFADAGTVNEEVSEYGGGRYLFGVGVGLRYVTPIGPLRFDFAFNPDREDDEELFVFHFSLGYPF